MNTTDRIADAYNRTKEIIKTETVNDGIYVPASDIVTILIQNVGRFCEKHAADFLMDWNKVVETINEYKTKTGHSITYVAMGIRELGVDGNEMINIRLDDTNNSFDFIQNYYRKIFVIAIERKKHEYFDEFETVVTLKEVKSAIRS